MTGPSGKGSHVPKGDAQQQEARNAAQPHTANGADEGTDVPVAIGSFTHNSRPYDRPNSPHKSRGRQGDALPGPPRVGGHHGAASYQGSAMDPDREIGDATADSAYHTAHGSNYGSSAPGSPRHAKFAPIPQGPQDVANASGETAGKAGQDKPAPKPHSLTHAEDGHVARPVTVVARLATLPSRWNWVNWACAPTTGRLL
jgi:hypothetical protein